MARRRSGKNTRSCRGQAIAEGGVFLVIFTMLAVGMILFILNISVILTTKQKVNFMAHQVAAAYSEVLLWDNGWRQGVSESQAKKYASKILDRLVSLEGLSGNPKLTISRDRYVVTAKIKVTKIGLFGGGGLFPSFCDVEEVAAVPIEKNQPYCLVSIRTSDGKQVVVPGYGFDLGTISNGNGNFRQLGLENMALNGFPLPNSGILINLPAGSSSLPGAFDRKIYYP